MMSRNASRLIRSVAVHAHGSPRYFSTATLRTITTESAPARILNGPGGVFHVVDPGKVSERVAATWIKLPVMGARSASTGALDPKDQKKVETGSAGGVAAGGGGSDDKAIVSYWGISPGKVSKEDGSEWRWNCFRPWETYTANVEIDVKKHHVPVKFSEKVAFWLVKALRYPTDLFFQIFINLEKL